MGNFNQDKDVVLNTLMKYVGPFNKFAPQKAPELETYEDYAPVDTPINTKCPTLSTNKTVGNYLTVKNDSYYGKSTPLPINEIDLERPAHFLGLSRNAFNDKFSGQNLSYFFKKNPFNGFDMIGKSDIVDPSDWQKIAKKIENDSPLLRQPSMGKTEEGFMPGNYFDVGQIYSSIC